MVLHRAHGNHGLKQWALDLVAAQLADYVLTFQWILVNQVPQLVQSLYHLLMHTVLSD